MVERRRGLICTDLDGTLLDPDKQITDRVQRAIKEIAQRGYVIAISSGRHPFNVFELMDSLSLPRNCVCLSGAATFAGGDLIGSFVLGQDAVSEAIAIACDEGAYVSAGGAGFNISCGSVSRGSEAKAKAFSLYGSLASYEELAAAAGKREGSVLKLALHAADDAQYLRLRRKLGSLPGVRCVRSDALWLDVTSSSCTKAAGIAQLARYFGISQAKVAVLGDDENDMEAISQAGFGIAMGNAIPAVKAAASLVVSDNAHDGAAEGLAAAAQALA